MLHNLLFLLEQWCNGWTFRINYVTIKMSKMSTILTLTMRDVPSSSVDGLVLLSEPESLSALTRDVSRFVSGSLDSFSSCKKRKKQTVQRLTTFYCENKDGSKEVILLLTSLVCDFLLINVLLTVHKRSLKQIETLLQFSIWYSY